jgi:hypothetical protein
MFLANDSMKDLVLAFLKSFRRFNPEIALCLIPYNADIFWLKGIRADYNFTIYEKQDILEWCDEISIQFHGRLMGQYRKLACWHTDFEQFVYVDVDTVILHDLAFSFDLLPGFGFLTSHSDLPDIRKWVWRSSINQQSVLSGKQVSFAANTGFIVSERNALTKERVDALLPGALQIRVHMELLTAEQPFLNYLIVTSGLRYSSFLTMARISQRRDIPQERWGGYKEPESSEGIVTEPTTYPLLLIHWAGEWRSGTHLSSKLWQFYRWSSDEAHSPQAGL